MSAEQQDLFRDPPPPRRPESPAKLAWRGAELGMQQAAAHADRVTPAWQGRARAMLDQYLQRTGAAEFVTPDVRWWAESQGLPAPPSKRAWGAVILGARREGVIQHAGYRDYGDVGMHTQAVKVWRRAT